MKILVLIFLLIYSIPTRAETPNILGSTAYWQNYDKTVKDIKVGNLRIKQVRKKDANCSDGYSDVLELDGEFNEDTVLAIEKLLGTMKNCDGSPPILTLNSGGGYLVSGIEVGRIFRKFGVTTWLVDGQKCQSSCSTAFFGGKVRKMSSDSEVLMHSPYLVTSPFSISCMSKIEAQRLKDYYIEMLNDKVGELLFERTMKHCSTTDGWRLNNDAAELFGLLNEEEVITTYYEFPETFTTNLKDSRKFLQVRIGVSTQYVSVLENVENHALKLRSGILGVMNEFSEEDIGGGTGRDNLAKAIIKELNKKLEHLEGFGGITEVHFTSFILQ